MGRNHPQTLLIDADDTLWENNIYFERAIADFISFLNHRERSPAEIREILNDVRGLAEKEWVISRIELGASAYSRFKGVAQEDDRETAFRALLVDLVREPIR